MYCIQINYQIQFYKFCTILPHSGCDVANSRVYSNPLKFMSGFLEVSDGSVVIKASLSGT